MPAPVARTQITLADTERAELERRLARFSTPNGDAQRARVILMAADGVPHSRIHHAIGMAHRHVTMWVERFAKHRLKGLIDRRSLKVGRPEFSPSGGAACGEDRV